MKKRDEIYSSISLRMGMVIDAGEDGVAVQIPFGPVTIRCIASWGMGWDHVSITITEQDRCPTWEEMCFAKDIFWDEDETVIQYHPAKIDTVIQYHPAKIDYINCHPYCLHIWKPQGVVLPVPPYLMIGPKDG